jgi:hypothetical protein
MASSFGSFNRSPLGAFIKSPLGARGGGEPGTWLVRTTSTTQYYSSEDGVTFKLLSGVMNILSQGSGPYGGVPSIERIFSQRCYSDKPYANANAAHMKLGGTNFAVLGINLQGNPIRSGSRLLGYAGNSFAYSDDNGANWTAITPPNPGGTATSVNGMRGHPIITQSGRILTIVNWNHSVAPTVRLHTLYSDDGGDTWNSTGQNLSVAVPGDQSTADVGGLLYQHQSSGRIWYIPRTTATVRSYSDDDGLTWTDTTVAAGNHTTPQRAFARSDSRVINNTVFYTDDDWANRTTITGTAQGIVLPNGDQYRANATTDKLEKSTDGGATWADVVTNPTDFGALAGSTGANVIWKYGAIW